MIIIIIIIIINIVIIIIAFTVVIIVVNIIVLTRLTREAMNQILKKLAIKSQENMKKSKDEMTR